MSTPFTEETFADRLRGRTVKELHDLRHRLQNERGPKAALLAGEASRSGRSDAEIEEINRDVVALNDQIAAVNAKIEQHARVAEAYEKNPGAVEVAFGHQQPAGGDGSRGHVFDAARRVVDQAFRSNLLPAHAAEKVIALVDQGPARERTQAANWVRATGNPDYMGAFAKLLSDPTRGHLLWTPEEQDAYRAVEEYRAMSLTDANGGYMVPMQLDPAIMLTSAGSNNPLRRLARNVQTVTEAWNGVTSAGATAEWKTEGSQVADGSPTLAPAPIPVYFGDSYVPYSFEVGMDAIGFASELQKVLVDTADQLMATAYTTGTGTNQPTGVITALVASSPSVLVASATADTFAKADVYALQNALPPRFSSNASWCANIAVINLMSQMETTAGARLFPEIADGRLLNKPINELSNMDGVINAAAENYVLLYGDFKAGFVIADRIGTQIELIANVMGANGRPTGERGALLWFRTGSDSVVDNAFRLLNVT